MDTASGLLEGVVLCRMLALASHLTLFVAVQAAYAIFR